jgi:hypothetical protein
MWLWPRLRDTNNQQPWWHPRLPRQIPSLDLTVIREVQNGLYQKFDIGDVDGDGTYEVIQVTYSPDELISTSLATGQTLFRTPTSEIRLLRLTDYDNDGVNEILISEEGSPETISQVSGSGIVFDTIESPSSNVTNILLADFGSSGDLEYLWTTGSSSTALDRLLRADIATQDTLRNTHDFIGPYRFSDMGDVFNDGRNYIGISHDKAYASSGGVSLIDINQGSVHENTYPSSFGFTLRGTLTALATGNIDSDEKLEICFAGGFSNRNIICEDPVTNDTEVSIDQTNGYIYQLELFDLDNDSDKEIVMISDNGYISSYYANNGFVQWQSEPFLNEDISWGFDGIKQIRGELWVFFLSGNAYELNPLNGEIIQTHLNTSITNVDVQNGNLYAFKQGVGLGTLDLKTMDIDQILYPTTETFLYLNVSEDEKNVLLAYKLNDSEYSPILISLENTFSPWVIGTTIYDAYLPNFLQLLLTSEDGAISYDLKPFHDEVFVNGFE